VRFLAGRVDKKVASHFFRKERCSGNTPPQLHPGGNKAALFRRNYAAAGRDVDYASSKWAVQYQRSPTKLGEKEKRMKEKRGHAPWREEKSTYEPRLAYHQGRLGTCGIVS